MAKSKNKHNLSAAVGSSIVRDDDRIRETGEIFTPSELCDAMVAEQLELLGDTLDGETIVTFIDNSAGCGNFLLALKKALLEYGYSERTILEEMLFAVERERDNYEELCANLGVEVDHKHYVCHDALTYDYSFDNSHLLVALDVFGNPRTTTS